MKASWAAWVILLALSAILTVDAAYLSLWSYQWGPILGAIGALVLLVTGRLSRRQWWSFIPAALWLIYLLIYPLNPSHEWHSYAGLLPLEPWPGWPASVHAERSGLSVWLMLMALSIFVMGRFLRPREVQRLLFAMVLLGAGMAALSIHQRMVPLSTPIYEYTGRFVSSNHFAAFINLLYPVALALGRRYHYASIQGERSSNPAVLCYVTAVLMALSLVLTDSRAGLLLCVVNTIVLGGWLLYVDKRYDYLMGRVSWWSAHVRGVITVAIVGIVGAMAYAAINHSAAIMRDLHFRFLMSRDAWRIVQDHPIFGTGPGTFTVVMPYYQSPELGNVQVVHAHNEYIQWLSEVGWVGVALGVLLIGGSLWWGMRVQANRLKRQIPACRELEIPALIAALGSIVIHGLVDFPFRAPLNLFMVALWLSLWVRMKQFDRDPGRLDSTSHVRQL